MQAIIRCPAPEKAGGAYTCVGSGGQEISAHSDRFVNAPPWKRRGSSPSQGPRSIWEARPSIPVLKVDEERWEQDRMIFRVRALGQAASGHLDVADDHVRVEVTLPWLLQRFAEVAQVAIRNRSHLLVGQTDADDADRVIMLRGQDRARELPQRLSQGRHHA